MNKALCFYSIEYMSFLTSKYTELCFPVRLRRDPLEELKRVVVSLIIYLSAIVNKLHVSDNAL